MTGVAGNRISDEKLVEATGRSRAEWHDLLDAQNASDWKHPQIASWLVEAHGVDGWWAQGITVAYEQARGMRVPGQQPDGTFSTSASKSLAGSPQQVLDLLIDAYTAASGSTPDSVSRQAKHPTARWKLADGTIVLATISPGTAGRSRAALTHSKLRDEAGLAPAKAELATVLGTLASRVDRSVD